MNLIQKRKGLFESRGNLEKIGLGVITSLILAIMSTGLLNKSETREKKEENQRIAERMYKETAGEEETIDGREYELLMTNLKIPKTRENLITGDSEGINIRTSYDPYKITREQA